MKHADTLNPAETLYESRFFEAMHRIWDDSVGFPLRMKRQVRVRCKSRDCPAFHFNEHGHQPGKLWIVDFLIWPCVVVELDGHEVRGDRDECLVSRGLLPVHLKNQDVRDMGDAMRLAYGVRQVITDMYVVKKILLEGRFSRSQRRDMGRIIWVLSGDVIPITQAVPFSLQSILGGL